MIHFVSSGLRSLDALHVSTVCAPLFDDQRPAQGILGDVDWRLAGSATRRLESGFLRGSLGESVVLGTEEKFPFVRVLAVGAGPLAAFSEVTYRSWLAHALRVLATLGVDEVALELPGVPETVELDEALTALMRATRKHPSLETVTVFGDAEFARVYSYAYERERRLAASEMPPR
jgi:hypothetical protein